MHLSQPFSLKSNNSFNFSTITNEIYYPASAADLNELPNLSNLNFYILGDGSNTLFVDHEAPIIIKPIFKGISIVENDNSYTLTIGSSENWHELVCYCLNKGINGLENLALIPGSVGAAPVQNIGAYGVEFSDFCTRIKWFDLFDREFHLYSKKQCQFAYRESIFKQRLRNRALITEVTITIPKIWRAKIAYNGLNKLSSSASAKQVMNTVINLRQEKLPDPHILPNAGSFFKNPIISKAEAKKLISLYPEMPIYILEDTSNVKLAAGWLIEHVGLKGFCYKNVGVHKKQALVLVNYKAKFGDKIITLAKYVQEKVYNQFGVHIFPEVRIVVSSGEIEFSDITEYEVLETSGYD